LDYYPDLEQLQRLVRMWSPSVIFISIENRNAATALNEHLDTHFASIQRMALNLVEEPAVLRLALELRMGGLIVPSVDGSRFKEILTRLADHFERHPMVKETAGQVYAFLPAKGGAGASTIAANSVRALADVPGSHVLLADFDISSGVAGFMFNAEHSFSINDAAIRNKELDEETWQRLVKKVGKVDLMLSGAPRFDEGIAPEQVLPVLEFARRSYSVVAADVPDTFDERTMAVLREANRIFLVTTPDLAALRLARLKVTFLRNLEWEDKTVLLLNRASKKMELSNAEIEATVGLPVFASFPCAYADVTRSVQRAEASPKLAAGIKQFVDKLGAPKPEKEKRTRFIERFALVPGRYGFQ
jgi:Flp pilus assembly CpaE family ATPase